MSEGPATDASDASESLADESKLSFDETNKIKAREPGESIFKGYRARRERQKQRRAAEDVEKGQLDEDERDPGDEIYLHDVLDRTRQIFSRYTIYRTKAHPETATHFEKLPEDTLRHERPNLKVICVGSDLDIWSQSKLKMTTVQDGCSILQPLENFNPSRWIHERIAELKAAIKLKPDIIIFPEFAYPPAPLVAGGGWTVDDVRDYSTHRSEFERLVLQAVKGHHVFLVMGSFHCQMTLYNVGVIFPWGRHRDGQASYDKPIRVKGRGGLENISHLPSTDRIIAPVQYRKRFPARKIGEQTRVPEGQGLNIFKTGFGNVLVLICSDILDINQFMTIIQQSLEHKDFDYILVPAYNPGKSFNKICRDLSDLAATTVIVANARDQGVDLTPSEIFICGRSASELPDSKWHEQHGIVTPGVKKVGHHTVLKIFDLHLSNLKIARDEQVRRLDPNDGFQKGGK
ncbi:hypothetical protein [Phenylobacterium sp.]|uniref:hypothetical protein n=1 Tax=Phenylobacterium sp. TaxID=1871053 RepID=UPI0035637584